MRYYVIIKVVDEKTLFLWTLGPPMFLEPVFTENTAYITPNKEEIDTMFKKLVKMGESVSIIELHPIIM